MHVMQGVAPTRALRSCCDRSSRVPHRQRNALSCHAVLQRDDPKQGLIGQERLQAERALEQLLKPSTTTTTSVSTSLSPPQPARLELQPGCVWHFAYGANINYETLARRDVKHPRSRDPAFLVNPNIKLVFKHRGGYATLEAQPSSTSSTVDGDVSHARSASTSSSGAGGQPAQLFPAFTSRVHGVLYQLTKDDFEKLLKREGGYVTREMMVETYDGYRVSAKVFVSGPVAKLQAEVRPTEKYMHLLRDGASFNYLDPLYQAWLSSIETVPSVGLGPEYFDTPAKYVAYGFLAVVGLVLAGFLAQH